MHKYKISAFQRHQIGASSNSPPPKKKIKMKNGEKKNHEGGVVKWLNLQALLPLAIRRFLSGLGADQNEASFHSMAFMSHM